MKLTKIVDLLNVAFNYVKITSKTLNIDESHALKHSMETFNYASTIYNNEIKENSFLSQQKDIIFVSSILHDMCDKKYINEELGVKMIKNYMENFMPSQKLNVVIDIITKMSYSKVKVNGYPNLGEYQLAYHIVRESDLLCSYDIDRCIIYGMYIEKLCYSEAVLRAMELFEDRVFKYKEKNLFVTEISKNISSDLELKTIEDIKKLQLFTYEDPDFF
jgi:HD superfamily phosphodiesterase